MMSLVRYALVLSLLIACSVATATELESELQKYSYALGHQTAQGLKRAGVQVDPEAFAAAVLDVLAGAPLQLSDEEIKAVKAERAKRAQEAKQLAAAENLEAGKAFLAENRGKPGIQELDSGLQYQIETEGEGESPAATDTVVVNYRGTLPDGTEFDSSYKRGQPATFALNRVIPGFGEAITKMKPGAKWTIFVPASMGYGLRGAGRSIGPNQVLIFDIELLEIKKEAQSG
jgi:FKBP-type peptidyl-prolyl cis-trans isomerase FklB